MKRNAAILFGLMVILLTGCASNVQTAETNTESAEIAENTTELTTSLTDFEGELSNGENAVYGKYKIEPGTVDTDAILSTLFADQLELLQNVQMNTVEADGGKSTEYSVKDGDVTHRWFADSGDLLYSNDREIISADRETAMETAEKFVDALGWELSEKPAIVANGNTYRFIYPFLYQNVELMGNIYVDLAPGNDEAPLIEGAYVMIDVGGNGINGIQVNAMPQITETLESYNPSADFIGEEQAEEITKEYWQTFHRDTDFIVEFDSVEIKIIYMPFRETDESLSLLPVYEVVTEGDILTFVNRMLVLIDAVIGYVYGQSFAE